MDNGMKYLTVTQVNEYVKMMMDSNPVLKNVWIRAEISNFTNHYRTGHFYFSLKDDGGLIRAVMFKSYAQNVSFALQDGMKVLVHGRVSAFVRDGQYQVNVIAYGYLHFFTHFSRGIPSSNISLAESELCLCR